MRQKVLIVAANLKIAGAQKMVEQLALNIDKAAYDLRVLVLSAPMNTAIERKLLDGGVSVHFLNKPSGFHPGIFKKAGNFIRAFAPDVIHTHVNSWLYVFPAAWGGKIKILHTIHSRAARQESNSVLRKLVTFLYHKKVMIPVAISDEIRQESTQVYDLPLEQVEMVYNPVDYRTFSETPKQTHERVVFVNVARFNKVKNQLFLIRAFAKAWQQNKDICLVMAGEGELLEDAKKLAAELGVTEAVDFLGNVENVPQLLARCDVFVLPSLTEGLPISMLEAEAAGLPVIASRIGGIPDVFSENGCLVEVNDEAALVDSMLLLAGNENLRREMGEKSQSIAINYAADAIARKYEELYHKYGKGNECKK